MPIPTNRVRRFANKHAQNYYNAIVSDENFQEHIHIHLPKGNLDGLHRHYSEKGYVLIHGQKAPMVGKICMDHTMVDVTDIPQASVGDPALIFGEDEKGHYLSPEMLAEQGGTIAHELIACLGPRIQRTFSIS